MKILYATDGSPHGWQAGELLAEVADRGRNRVTIVTIVDPGIFLPRRQEEMQWARREGEEIVKSAADLLRRSGFRPEGKVLEGLPGEEIVGLATTEEFDLTIVGAGAHSRIAEAILGSVSRFVLHHSPSSVLVVHHRIREGLRARALIGVDRSEGSALAVSIAGWFLDPDRVELEVASFAEVATPVPEYVVVGRFTDSVLRDGFPVGTAALEDARAAAGRAAGRLRSQGFSVNVEVETGKARRGLLDKATTEKCDLTIVGSRSLGPVRGALVGSVSEWIAHRAPAALVARSRFNSSVGFRL